MDKSLSGDQSWKELNLLFAELSHGFHMCVEKVIESS